MSMLNNKRLPAPGKWKRRSNIPAQAFYLPKLRQALGVTAD